MAKAASTGYVCCESKADQAQSLGVQVLEHGTVERQRKGMLRVSCPGAPVVEWDAPQDQHSAFLWRSDTVSFGAVKRNGVGKTRPSKAQPLAFAFFSHERKEGRRQAKPNRFLWRI